jgi:prepilin-type N-terminal cleavage/methylation domain-containing protein/prepilin-type processing-associated H-X9-DG protein
MRFRISSRNHAFTLIELLIVIAIIAILAAILFPVFARAKVSAFRTVDLSNVKQVGLANLIYTSDYDGMFMAFPYADTFSSPSYGFRQKGPFWTDRLMAYVKSGEIFTVSSNRDRAYYPRGYWLPGAGSAGETVAKYRVTYAVNHLISHADFHPDRPGAAAESAIDRPGEVALMGPQQQPFTFSSCQPQAPGSMEMDLVWNISAPDGGYGFELWGKGVEGGFFGGANFSYVDGHGKFVRTSNVGTASGDRYSYQGRDLFHGAFLGAKVRIGVSSDGTCPANRSTVAY